MLQWIGHWLARYLSQETQADHRTTNHPDQLRASLRKGDVLLVEGNTRFSTAIKYLTQSTWSHAALCIVDGTDFATARQYGGELLEADVLEGVRIIPLAKYETIHTRICRPVGLTPSEVDALIEHAIARLGQQYDLKNIVDLARYLIRTPPVPTQWRRRMLALGSGDPTRAICSSLIAQAYQSVQYPILPEIIRTEPDNLQADLSQDYNEVLHIRHHSLFAPRDFDLSPYFEIIKPTLRRGFDPHTLTWDTSETEH